MENKFTNKLKNSDGDDPRNWSLGRCPRPEDIVVVGDTGECIMELVPFECCGVRFIGDGPLTILGDGCVYFDDKHQFTIEKPPIEFG